jgi:hypothetical protein
VSPSGRSAGPRAASGARRRRSRAAPTVYVETSAVLRVLLEGDRALARRLARAPRRATSALTAVEARRGLRRALHEGRIDEAARAVGEAWLVRFLRSCDIVAMAGPVLARAEQGFPVEPVRTLDAIHVASAILWADEVGPVIAASCDRRVRDIASALGWRCIPT